jgi:hypothetical protein
LSIVNIYLFIFFFAFFFFFFFASDYVQLPTTEELRRLGYFHARVTGLRLQLIVDGVALLRPSAVVLAAKSSWRDDIEIDADAGDPNALDRLQFAQFAQFVEFAATELLAQPQADAVEQTLLHVRALWEAVAAPVVQSRWPLSFVEQRARAAVASHLRGLAKKDAADKAAASPEPAALCAPAAHTAIPPVDCGTLFLMCQMTTLLGLVVLFSDISPLVRTIATVCGLFAVLGAFIVAVLPSVWQAEQRVQQQQQQQRHQRGQAPENGSDAGVLVSRWFESAKKRAASQNSVISEPIGMEKTRGRVRQALDFRLTWSSMFDSTSATGALQRWPGLLLCVLHSSLAFLLIADYY